MGTNKSQPGTHIGELGYVFSDLATIIFKYVDITQLITLEVLSKRLQKIIRTTKWATHYNRSWEHQIRIFGLHH